MKGLAMGDNDPFYRLALAVITRALMDAGGSDPKQAYRASSWLQHGDGRNWLELAGLNPDVLLEWLQSDRELPGRQGKSIPRQIMLRV